MMKEFNSKNGVVVSLDVESLNIQNISENGKVLKIESKSEVFRKMYKWGFSISEISNIMNSHYSFVYGVISNSFEIEKSQKTSKSDIIREMCDKGMTVGNIAKELNSNYSFVHSVCKKYKESSEYLEKLQNAQ